MHIALIISYSALIVIFAGSTLVTLVWMLHAWRTPSALDATRFPDSRGAPSHSFSLIVPARHEHTVLRRTLAQLARIDHPDFEVLVVVGDDDEETTWVARKVAEDHPGRFRVLVDETLPRSKPAALNAALAQCEGEIVGIFDAEDHVHARLLRHVDAIFATTSAEVVQGGVQLMNYRSSWFAPRNVLEYYFWFRSRLQFHAEQEFIPLGGNTVFVLRSLLKSSGGWDERCLAEDCELGTRLSVGGATVVVAYDPELATREETPHSLRSLVRQRTRWHQGFLQVLRKGDWRDLPFRRRMLALFTLSQPFVQAIAGLLVPVFVTIALFVKMPVLIALGSFFPLAVTLTLLAIECAALGDFCREFGERARLRDYARLVLGALPYQLVLSFSALRATVRELAGVGTWEKTEHAGAHL